MHVPEHLIRTSSSVQMCWFFISLVEENLNMIFTHHTCLLCFVILLVHPELNAYIYTVFRKSCLFSWSKNDSLWLLYYLASFWATIAHWLCSNASCCAQYREQYRRTCWNLVATIRRWNILSFKITFLLILTVAGNVMVQGQPECGESMKFIFRDSLLSCSRKLLQNLYMLLPFKHSSTFLCEIPSHFFHRNRTTPSCSSFVEETWQMWHFCSVFHTLPARRWLIQSNW